MKAQRISMLMATTLFAAQASAWDAKVTRILQHGTVVAVYLSPDPGPGSCAAGSPFLMVADDSADAKQRFAMIMMALANGNYISGYDDGCSTAIWAQSHPLITRLHLIAN